jgi:hypothetical protein
MNIDLNFILCIIICLMMLYFNQITFSDVDGAIVSLILIYQVNFLLLQCFTNVDRTMFCIYNVGPRNYLYKNSSLEGYGQDLAGHSYLLSIEISS